MTCAFGQARIHNLETTLNHFPEFETDAEAVKKCSNLQKCAGAQPSPLMVFECRLFAKQPEKIAHAAMVSFAPLLLKSFLFHYGKPFDSHSN
ncbi:MAG: hypothetical protein WBA92_18420 [Pseudorhodobacter sp.]